MLENRIHPYPDMGQLTAVAVVCVATAVTTRPFVNLYLLIGYKSGGGGSQQQKTCCDLGGHGVCLCKERDLVNE